MLVTVGELADRRGVELVSGGQLLKEFGYTFGVTPELEASLDRSARHDEIRKGTLLYAGVLAVLLGQGQFPPNVKALETVETPILRERRWGILGRVHIEQVGTQTGERPVFTGWTLLPPRTTYTGEMHTVSTGLVLATTGDIAVVNGSGSEDDVLHYHGELSDSPEFDPSWRIRGESIPASEEAIRKGLVELGERAGLSPKHIVGAIKAAVLG